ncbi:uncharacterized protein [Argopecten irradians]|uniref:uncharacterized protein n=1 Tax=Argopecten irradians TaxID=31199 RepID=UPI003716E8AA
MLFSFYFSYHSRAMDQAYNSSDTEQNTLSSLHYTMSWTLFSVSTVAFMEHFLILLLTCMNKSLRKRPYVLSVLLLSSSDILLSFALFLMSLIILVPLQQTWVCGFAYFLTQLGFVTSLAHTLIICTERYLCSRPVPMKVFSLRKRQVLTLMMMLTCSLILGVPYLFTVKESTVRPCLLLTLYQDRLAYALVPVRSMTFTIWSITIGIYVITIKNFRGVRRTTARVDRNVIVHNYTSPKAVKWSNNDECYFDQGFPSGSTADISNVGESNISYIKVKSSSVTSTDHPIVRQSQETQLTTLTHDVRLPYNDRNTTNNSGIQSRSNGKDANHGQTTQVNKSSSVTFDNAGPSGVSPYTFQGSVIRPSNTKPHSHATVEAFWVVSVVFVVFLVSMTPQAVVGLVMLFHPLSHTVEFGCAILALSSIMTNPIIFLVLLKDFRRVVLRLQ